MDEDKKKKMKPICADCGRFGYGTGICSVIGRKVRRTDSVCEEFLSKNPNY